MKTKNRFRPSLEALERRLMLNSDNCLWENYTGDGLWGTDGNWMVNGSPNQATRHKPGATDVAIFGGGSGANCGGAAGSVGRLSMQTSYGGTLKLSADLDAGGPTFSNGLDGTTSTQIDLNGHTLTLGGGSDIWNRVGFVDSSIGGGGTVVVTGWCQAVMTSRQKCEVLLKVPGSLVFENAGGLAFGDAGAVDVPSGGRTYFDMGTPADVTFTWGTGNANKWTVQGNSSFKDPGHVITTALPLDVKGTGWVDVVANSTLKTPSVILTDSANLTVYAGTSSTTVDGLVNAYDSSSFEVSEADGTNAAVTGDVVMANSSYLDLGRIGGWLSAQQPVFSVANLYLSGTAAVHVGVCGDAGGQTAVEVVATTITFAGSAAMTSVWNGTVVWAGWAITCFSTSGGITGSPYTYADNISGASSYGTVGGDGLLYT